MGKICYFHWTLLLSILKGKTSHKHLTLESISEMFKWYIVFDGYYINLRRTDVEYHNFHHHWADWYPNVKTTPDMNMYFHLVKKINWTIFCHTIWKLLSLREWICISVTFLKWWHKRSIVWHCFVHIDCIPKNIG